jgi:hypothetical protein
MLTDLLNSLKGYAIRFLIGKVMQIGGGAFAAVGISQGSIEEVVTGVVTVLIGLLSDLGTHQKAVNAEPRS